MKSHWLTLAFALCACGGARGTSGFDDDSGAQGPDGSVDTGNTPLDAGTVPPPDTGNTPLDTGPVTPTDTGVVTPTDTGNGPFDTGSVPPADTGNGPFDTGVVPPPDTGSGGVCPPSCQTERDCDPCRAPGDPAGSNYCCMSGLCLFMSGVCAPPPVDAGPPPTTDVDLNFGDLGDTGP